MSVSQKEIAKLLGITQATVSRALSDSPKVSPELKVRVRDLCGKLDYHPNYLAASLSLRRTRTISAVISSDPDLLVTEIHSHWMASLHYHASQLGYRFRLDTAGSVGQVLNERSADGLILFAGLGERNPEVLATLLASRHPIVLTDCAVSERRAGSVAIDGRVGIAEAVGHLVGLGHRRIAFAGYVDSSGVCRERREAYVAKLNELGLTAPPDLTLQLPSWPRETAEIANHTAELVAMLASGATAFVCSSDYVAAGVVKVVGRLGLHVPSDVSVTGFDDTMLSRAYDPSLSTVHQDTDTAGKVAVETVIRAIEGSSMPDAAVIPAPFLVRESTGPRR